MSKRPRSLAAGASSRPRPIRIGGSEIVIERCEHRLGGPRPVARGSEARRYRATVTQGDTDVTAVRRADEKARPLAWRIFLVNAAVFALGTAALALSPATVSWPIALTEALVLVAGLTTTLVVNLLLVRRSLAPLERLASLMHRIDLLQPGQRLDATGSAEVHELGAVFNEMLDRLEEERHESGWAAFQGQEMERKRIAQELHDEIGQALTAVMLQLSRLVK